MTITTVNSEHFSSPYIDTSGPLAVTSIPVNSYTATNLLPVATDSPTLTISHHRISCPVVLCDELLSLSLTFSRFSYVVACSHTSFLFIAKLYSMIWIFCFLFICQLMNTWVVSALGLYYDLCYSEHSCISFYVDVFSLFLGICLGVK